MTWSAALKWLQHVRLQPGQSNTASQLACTSVEKLIFTRALSLRDDPPKIDAVQEIQAMEAVVDLYRLVVKASQQTAAQMKVSTQSRELLVVWSAFCLAHQAAGHQHPMIKTYGVALQASDLKHLVLSDKLAVDATRVVATYLRVSAQRGSPIFSLRPSDQTFILARQFARESSEMMRVWEQDVKASEQRREVRWVEVKRTQAEIRNLRKELDEYECDHNRAEHRLRGMKGPSRYTSDSEDAQYRDAERKLSRLADLISETKSTIKRKETPPAPLLQPLPQSKETAMPILFFLQMPIIFQVLSRMSFMAQQMLLPNQIEVAVPRTPSSDDVSDSTIKIKIETKEPGTLWNDYYKDHKGTCSPVDSKVIMGSWGKIPDGKSLGPNNIMEYTSNNDGVWHPDQLTPDMWWCGGHVKVDSREEKYFNPFAEIDSRATVLYFTETLQLQQICCSGRCPCTTAKTRKGLAVMLLLLLKISSRGG